MARMLVGQMPNPVIVFFCGRTRKVRKVPEFPAAFHCILSAMSSCILRAARTEGHVVDEPQGASGVLI